MKNWTVCLTTTMLHESNCMVMSVVLKTDLMIVMKRGSASGVS